MALSVECFRAFVFERLRVAAEEIFQAFQQKIAEHEAEMNSQRRLVESFWGPVIKLHRYRCRLLIRLQT